MSPWLLYAASAVGVFAAGIFGAFGARTRVVRRILGVNVMGAGVFVLLIASARRTGSAAPDPIPHALVLTGIVVSVSGTALAVAITRRLAQARPREDDPSAPHGQSR